MMLQTPSMPPVGTLVGLRDVPADDQSSCDPHKLAVNQDSQGFKPALKL